MSVSHHDERLLLRERFDAMQDSACAEERILDIVREARVFPDLAGIGPIALLAGKDVPEAVLGMEGDAAGQAAPAWAAVLSREGEMKGKLLNDRLEAAQCIWEEVLERSMDDAGVWREAFECRGTSAIRAMVRETLLLDACNAGWEYLRKKYPDEMDDLLHCYDWDYVPVFVEACVSPETGLREDWRDRLAGAFLSVARNDASRDRKSERPEAEGPKP